ncbi:TPA: WGR domain-containing protein [Legionella pneumophila]
MQTPWFTAPSLLHLIHFYPIEAYHDARFEKDTRYYVIRLSKDLLEDWVITLINGRIKSKLGQSRTLAFAHFNEAFEHFCLLTKVRLQRGYQLKTFACDNALLLHLLPFLVMTENDEKLADVKTAKNENRRTMQSPASLKIRNSSQGTYQQMGFSF